MGLRHSKVGRAHMCTHVAASLAHQRSCSTARAGKARAAMPPNPFPAMLPRVVCLPVRSGSTRASLPVQCILTGNGPWVVSGVSAQFRWPL